MASEVLAIPESKLLEFLDVIEAGIMACNLTESTEEYLREWCEEYREYTKDWDKE